MVQIIPLDGVTLVPSPMGSRSFLPEFLAKTPANNWGPVKRAFVIAENRPKADFILYLREKIAEIAAAHGGLQDTDVIFLDRSAEVGAIRAKLDEMIGVFDGAKFDVRRVIYASQNPRVALAPGTTGPRWMFFHHYMVSVSRKYRQLGGDYEFSKATNKILCLNNKMRPHRLALAAALRSMVEDRLLMSWGGVDAIYSREACLQEIGEQLPDFVADAAHDVVPLRRFNYTAGVGGDEDLPLAEAKAAFLHVVAESDYSATAHRFTEKTLKTMAAHRPFLVFGPPNVLKLIQSFGFKTFGDVFDESYDSIENPNERLHAMLGTLEDLLDQDHREVIVKTKAICAHNQSVLLHGLQATLQSRVDADVRRLTEELGQTAA